MPANPESQAQPHLVPPIDPSLLVLESEERQFLHAAVCQDDEELRKRILELQERAYERYPYPCIRGFHFVNLFMAKNAIYSSVLEAGKAGNTLLMDLGCMMGTDVRKLAYDGYPASQILGCDIRPEFIEMGYTLFRDKDSCPIKFIVSDVFQLSPSTGTASLADAATERSDHLDLSTVTDLPQLRNELTHIYAGALFHLFNEKSQYDLALRLASLLKRTPGAVIFGRHRGLVEEGTIADHLGRDRYGHSESSWATLWKKVFAEIEGDAFAESKVVIDTELPEDFAPHVGPQQRMHTLYWSVRVV